MRVLRNSIGVTKTAPRGFSFTMLFFGVFVPLLRGDFIWFIVSLLLAYFTYGISWFLLPFFYNNIYYNGLIKNGYREVGF